MKDIEALAKLFDLTLCDNEIYMNGPHDYGITEKENAFTIPFNYNCEFVFDKIKIKMMKEKAKKANKTLKEIRVEVNGTMYSFIYLNELYSKLNSKYKIHELRLKHDSNHNGEQMPTRIDIIIKHKKYYIFLAPKVTEIEGYEGEIINVGVNDIVIPLSELKIKKKLLKYGESK